MRALRNMRLAIREQRYRINSHANEEMSADNLAAQDVESIIMTGEVARKFTRDPQGHALRSDWRHDRWASRVHSVPVSAFDRIIGDHSLCGRGLMVNTMAAHDVCEFCDGEIEQRIIRARFSYKGHTIYIEGVPAWVCAKCGEQYFDAPVYKQLEEIARHQKRIKRTICFPLAEYGKVPA